MKAATFNRHGGRRSWRVAVALVAAAAVATGCGAGESESTDESTTISLIYPTENPGYTEALSSILGPDFTERTGIIVELQSGAATYVEVDQRMLADAAAGTAPDMAMVAYPSIPRYADTGVAKPLDDALDASAIDLGELYPNYVELGKVDATTYALPHTVTLMNLWYNADIFEKAGLDPEAPPTNFTELREASEQVVSSGAAKTGVGWRIDSTASWPYQHYVLSAGGRLVDAEGMPAFDSPESIETLRYWTDMQQDGLAFAAPGSQVEQTFLQGDSAMTLNTSSQLLNWDKASTFDMRVAQLPVADGGSPALLALGSSLIVTSDDPDKQAAAMQVAQALINEAGQTTLIGTTGYLSVNQAAVEEGDLAPILSEEPRRATMAAMAQHVVAWPQLDETNSQEAWDLLDDATEQAMTGTTPAEDALGGAQEAATGVLR